jgi:formylglycine-generating enzyme required for sulfatase activity
VPVLENSVGMRFALIPPGKFLMGSPPGEEGRESWEGPQHEVEVTRPFYLGVFPVTQAQYQKVMGTNPSRFAGNPDHPVEQVSWEDAQAFCRRMSELAEEKQFKRRYALPTEAQWEHACRGGEPSSTPFHLGASLSAAQANFDGRHPYGGGEVGPWLWRTSPVGAYKAVNAFGLYDLHGNVWEWCADWFDEGYYGSSPGKDPTGPATGQSRVLRGGSWCHPALHCRTAFRDALEPDIGSFDFGFRVALLHA